MMANIPNLVYLEADNEEEYLAMLDWSIEQKEHPVATKLPGGRGDFRRKRSHKRFQYSKQV